MTAARARSVLITGCSSGIGRCLADGIGKRQGYRVFAAARRLADVERLREAGHESLQLDLADPRSIAGAAERVLELSGGRLDMLVNNGAYGQPGAVEDLSREALRAQLEVNVLGAHELTTHVLPSMRRHASGRVIQISSILGLVCLPFRGAYNASKYALEALSDTLRLELRGSGIQVSLIEPGPIESRFRDNAMQRFAANIDPQRSPHRERYTALQARFESGEPDPFTLPPEAVLRKTLLAMERRRPRPRYRVTVPAHGLASLKRVLPDRALDAVVGKLSR